MVPNVPHFPVAPALAHALVPEPPLVLSDLAASFLDAHVTVTAAAASAT